MDDTHIHPHHLLAVWLMYALVFSNATLLMFFPRKSFTFRWMNSAWLHLVPAIPYCFFVAPGFTDALVNFLNLPLLSHGFLLPSTKSLEFFAWWSGTANGMTSFWLHMAIIDLFAARWMWLDALKHGARSWHAMRVLLLIAFTFPGAGPLFYFAYRRLVLGGTLSLWTPAEREQLERQAQAPQPNDR